MIEKHLKDLYNVDTISQDKGWKKLLAAVEELEQNLDSEDKEIMIDFKGINVVDPWDFGSFKQLIKKENIHMRFTNCEELVNRIKMMYLFDGYDENNVENVYVEVPREKTLEEKRIEMYSAELVKLFEVNGNEAYFKVAKRYDQLQNTNTVAYIKAAMDTLINEQKVNKILLDFDGIKTLNNVLEIFADLIVEYATNGVELSINIVNEEDFKNMGLFMHKATAKVYDEKSRYKLLRKIENNTPLLSGMLLTYKKSRALDEFGRSGKGEVISSRIAIFAGIGPAGENNDIIKRILGDNAREDISNKVNDKQAGRSVAKFITFNNNYFCTKTQWLVEHDNESLERVKFDLVEVSMDELGFGDYFLGSRYHFITPVQKSAEENTTIIVDIDDDGRNVRQSCTIPERMKIVFNDWDIKYNTEELDKAIISTREQLNNI